MERIQKKEKQKATAGMNPVQMAKVMGNQNVMQMCGDSDSEFVLKPKDEKVDEELDEIDFNTFMNNIRYDVENVPKQYIYIPDNADCYGGIFATSCVHIEMTGGRLNDYNAADTMLQGINANYKPEMRVGYTWHHLITRIIGECDMVLVKTEVHKSKRHMGAVHQYVREMRRNGDLSFTYGT